MSDTGTTDYESVMRDVETKYKSIIERRKFQSVSYMMWLFIFGVQRLISVVLRFPLFRVPYVSAMNSGSSPKKLRNLLEWGARRAVTIRPSLSRAFTSGKALIIYYSTTGNTEKAALAVQQGVRKAGLEPIMKKVSESFNEELYGYDLVCIGTPVIHGLPPHPIMKFMLEKGSEYRRRNDIRINQQAIPGKNALVFVTFSGPHIGVVEAIPAGKYIQQSLAHMGFDIKGEWYVVAEFHGWKDGSTRGRLGDIRGRPNTQDLARIEEKTIKLVKSLNDGSTFPFSTTVWCTAEEV